MNKKKVIFWERVQECKRIVKTWPKWMQKITINYKTISSGEFIEENNNENN